MKELDKTKKYDLSKLTDEQLIRVVEEVNRGVEIDNKVNLNWLKCFKDTHMFYCLSGCWRFTEYTNDNYICATELFEDETEKSIKDILAKDEHGRYDYTWKKQNISNNKPMTEEEKELWLFVYKESVKKTEDFICRNHKEKANQAVKDFREALKM